MTVQSPEVETTLDGAVKEVLGVLTGHEMTYVPEYDRYYIITRLLNRALRLVALEKEWSWYADTVSLGLVVEGVQDAYLTPEIRPRIIKEDAIRLVDTDGLVRMWAYFLPRDAGDKQQLRSGLWVTSIRDRLHFSRPFREVEAGLDIQLPVMREPNMFVLPERPEDPDTELTAVPDAVRDQLIDFAYPDLVVAKAAQLYAMTDPVMQPRVQTLEAMYKDVLYALIERDDRNTDSPEMNGWFVPIQSGLRPLFSDHAHPHADERRW